MVLCVSAVSAQDLVSDDGDSLFSCDDASFDTSMGVALDESQLDSNIQSDDSVSQSAQAFDEQVSTINQDDQSVSMGSADSSLGASENTYAATDETENILGSIDSPDILSADDGDGNDDSLTATKKATNIYSDNIVGYPAEIVTVYAIVIDEDGKPVTSGTAVFTTNGQTYYATVKSGLAIFRNVELPMKDTTDEMMFLENDEYGGSSTQINITVEIDPDRSGNDDSIPDQIYDDSTNETTSHSSGYKETSSNLQKYPTANPIVALLLALVVFAGGSIRTRK